MWCKYRRLKCSETGRGRLERKKKEDVHLRRKEEAWDEHGFQQACQSWNCIWTACHCSLEGGTQATFLCPEPEQQVPLSLKPNAGATLITSWVQYTWSLDPHESSGSVHAKEGVAGLLKNKINLGTSKKKRKNKARWLGKRTCLPTYQVSLLRSLLTTRSALWYPCESRGGHEDVPTPAGGKREEGGNVQCFFAQQQTIHVRKSQSSDPVSDTGVSAPRWHLTATEPPLKGLEFRLVMGQEEERRKHQHTDTSPEKEAGWSWASIDVWAWGNTDSKQKLWSKAGVPLSSFHNYEAR